MSKEELQYIRFVVSLGWKAIQGINELEEGDINENKCFEAFEKLAEKIGVGVFDILDR